MMKNLFQKLFGLNRIEVVDAGYERQITQPSAAQISEPPEVVLVFRPVLCRAALWLRFHITQQASIVVPV